MTKRLTVALCGALVLLSSGVRAQSMYSPEFLERRETFAQFGSAVAVGDFDRDGRDDLAVGAPGSTVNGVWRAGRVCVYFTLGVVNTASCISQGAAAREMDDQFGATLAAGDFNGDGFDDLVVGIPSEDFGTVRNAGAVAVFAGNSFRQFTSSTSFVQGMPFTQGGMPRVLRDSPESGDKFGAALAVGDFDADGFDDLAVGVPGEDVFSFGQSVPNAGAVHVLYGDAGGLGVGNAVWVQDNLLPSSLSEDSDYEFAEAADQFGYSLATGRFNDDAADDLAIGVPFDDRYSWDGALQLDAGVVHVMYGSPFGLRTPNGGYSGGGPPRLLHLDVWNRAAEALDRFGFAVAGGDLNANGIDDLVIGVPGDDNNRGGVLILSGETGGIGNRLVFWSTQQYWPQAGDECGRALTFGDFDGDGIDDLVVAMPGDDRYVSRASGRIQVSNAGSVHVTHGAVPSPYENFVPFNPSDLSQNDGRTPGRTTDWAESGDRYGSVVAAGDFDGDGADDLAVAIPFEDTTSATTMYPDGGAVEVLWGYVLP
jgi:hypothetical protein